MHASQERTIIVGEMEYLGSDHDRDHPGGPGQRDG